MKPREGRTDCDPGRSDSTESSSVIYSSVSLFSPARGCSCEGSAKAELPRKESTPWAEEGSKDEDVYNEVEVELDGNGCPALPDEVGEPEDAVEEPGEPEAPLRPVRVSQREDMLIFQVYC